MLKESELIALVEVVRGGKFIAKVRPLSVFKGHAESDFTVVGFNNSAWPADVIETESFKEQQQYYLFLAQRDDAPQYLEFMARVAEPRWIRFARDVIGLTTGWRPTSAQFKAELKAAQTGRLRFAWTPSAGDLPVDGEKVRYSLLSSSYSQQAAAHERSQFERFLVAAIAYHENAQTDAALLNDALEVVRREAAKAIPSPDPATMSKNEHASDLSHWLATYFLLGGRVYDPVFEGIARSEDLNARFMLARLLGSVRDEPAGKLLRAMLEDANSVVQGEVVRQLAKGDPQRVGPLLHAHLIGAAKGGIGPRNIMDPVRNRLDGGQVEIARALGELKYQAAAPDLIRLLDSTDDAYHLRVLLEALEKMGSRDYARALEKPLRNPKLMMTIAEWVGDHRLIELRAALQAVVDDPPEAAVGGSVYVAIDALGKIGDETTGAWLTTYLQKLTSREVPEFFDDGYTERAIEALAKLRYKPAREAVEQAIFYWQGVDATFQKKPELLDVKRRLEREIEREALARLRDFRVVEADALVFLKNRGALAEGAPTQPEYSFGLHVDVRSPEHPELDAENLKTRIVEQFRKRQGMVSVRRWTGNRGFSEGRDLRAGRTLGSSFFSYYGQYVQATRDPQDLRFVKFLLDSGLAKSWGAKSELDESIASTSQP